MTESPQHKHDEELEEDPNAKFFSEIFIDEEESFMNTIDFNAFIEFLCDWLDEEEKIDPNIARYMGLLMLSIAEKLENKQQ